MFFIYIILYIIYSPNYLGDLFSPGINSPIVLRKQKARCTM